jgi:hypothetical protein
MIGLLMMGGAATLCIIALWPNPGTWRITRVALVLWCAAIVAVVFHLLPLTIATWVTGVTGLLLAANVIFIAGGPPDTSSAKDRLS